MLKRLMFTGLLLVSLTEFVTGGPSNPTIARLYGDYFVNGVPQGPNIGLPGSIDKTFGVNGIVNFQNSLAVGQARAIKVLPDGSLLVGLSSSGSNSMLAKCFFAGAVGQTGFGTTGVVDLDVGSAVIQTMIHDQQNRMLVAGGDDTIAGTAGWLSLVSADGMTITRAINGTPWQFIGGLAQQSTGNVIAVGSDNNNAQIARYVFGTSTTAGILDTSFGNNGTLIFNGNSGFANIKSGLYSVVIDSNNQIYVCYIDGSNNAYVTRLTENGTIDTTFGVAGVATIPYLNGVAANQLRMAIDNYGNLVIAGQVGSAINVTSIKSANGVANSSFTNCTITSANSILDIKKLITTSDNKIFVVGSNQTNGKSRVTRLTNTGIIDKGFNGTGFNEFGEISGMTSNVFGAVISQDGRLYCAGSQIKNNQSSPYLACVYNTPYISQINQSAVVQSQGIFDKSFGTREAISGVVTPFNGLYESLLQQKARYVIELISGKLLVGMDGKLNTSNTSNMMLSRLTSAGIFDTNFGSGSGCIALPNNQINEYISTLLEDASTNIYVAGTSNAGAILRKYTAAGAEIWVGDMNSSGYKGLDVALQGTTRVLLGMQVDQKRGAIAAYSISTGLIDTTFRATGSSPGSILPADFGLNMGPIYKIIVNAQENFFVAYQNSVTNAIDVAAFYKDGSGLITNFGVNGVVANIFSVTNIAANNVRIAFDENYDIFVVASTGSGFLVACLDGVTGLLDPLFNSNGLLSIPSIGVSINIQKVTGLSDGSIMLTAYDTAGDDTMIVVRITAAGALDTTFNAQGAIPGILPFKIGDQAYPYNCRIATSLTVQSSTGNLIVTGYEQMTPTDSTPIVVRIYGKPGTTEIESSPLADSLAGTLDVTFNQNGALDLTSMITSGKAKAVYSYRSGNINQGRILVGIDTGSSIQIARIDSSDVVLDNNFGKNGVVVIPNTTGLTHISIDAANNILVAGSNNGKGWMQRITNGGVVDVVSAVPSDIVAINRVYQQKSGRYIAAANDASGNGVLLAFQNRCQGSSTTLAVDPSFNIIGSVQGRFVVGSAGLYNLAICNDDTIVVAYANSTVFVAKIKADGSALLQNFAQSGVLNTTIVPKNSSEIRCCIDSNNKIVVASSGTGNSLNIARYTSAGLVDTAFGGNGSIQTISNLGNAGATLTHLIVTNEVSGDDKIIAFGYNSGGGNDRLYAVRLSGNGLLDTSWNAQPKGTDTQGVSTFSVEGATTIYAGSVYINGEIYICATNAPGEKPLLIRMFGDNYITEAEQQPFQIVSGVIDTTLDTITPGSGALNLNTALTTTLGISQKLYMYSSGAMLLASNKGGTTVITKLKPDLSLDQTFGTNGYATINQASTINDMHVANGLSDDGSIYVTGVSGLVSWIAKLSASGKPLLFSTLNSLPLTTAYSIVKTTNQRIIVSGQNSTSGIVAAFRPDNLALDLSFADGLGYFATNIATPIVDIAIDNFNRIYAAYKDLNTSTIKVIRILSNGGGIDPTFTMGVISSSNSLSATQIRLALDFINNQLVVVAQDGTGAGNLLKVARFSTANGFAGVPTGMITNISIGSKILNLSDTFIDSLQNIYVVGYNSTNNYAVVARVASLSPTAIALDTTYAASGVTPGIANLPAGAMTQITDGALHQDRRVYFIGNNGSTPYMARYFGDLYTTESYPVTMQSSVGMLDITLDPNDTVSVGGVILSSLPGWSQLTGYTSYGVQANFDGTCYVAFGNGTNVIVGKFDADMNPITSFGTNGLTQTYLMNSINSIVVDAAGKVLVSGINSGFQSIVRFTQSGSVDVSFIQTASTASSTIAEQKSGRLVVGGLIGSTGVLMAYQNTGQALDLTFGPASLNGYYATGVNASIDDIVVDGNDCIYLVYRNNLNHVLLEKITSNGSGKVSAFNNGVTVDTGMIALLGQPACCAINNVGNILVGVTTNSSAQTCLFNGQTGVAMSSVQTIMAGNPIAPSIPLAAYPYITKLVGSGNDFIGSLTTTTPAVGAFRVLGSNGTLDANFATLGIALFTGANDPESATSFNSVAVQPDGRIVLVGTNTISPVLVRLYGYAYIPQGASMPGRSLAGLLDTTLSMASPALNLNNFTAAGLNLHGYAIKRVYESGNGVMLFVADNGSNAIIFRLLKDLSLDTAGFNSPSGYVTIPNKSTVRGLYVDAQGNIFVAGGSATSWVQAYNNNGTPLNNWNTPSVNFSNGAYQVGLQSCNRLILAGQNQAGGALYGYTNSGILDTEFGSAGVVSTGFASPVIDFAIDSLDRITYVYINAGNVALQRISAEGDVLTVLNSGTPISGVTGNEVRVILDNNNNAVVAAATTKGFALSRYSSTGANNGASISVVTGGTSSSRIGNIYVTSDNKIVLVGYELNGNKVVVVRCDANFNLDATFNNGAPLITTAIPMNLVYDGIIHADDRIMLVGGSSAALDPFMARVFGDAYTVFVPKSPAQGIAGNLDQTFGTAGLYNLAQLGTGQLQGAIGKSVMALADGGCFIALNNSTTSSKLIRTTAETTLNRTFGTTGFASDAPDGVENMITDAAGHIIFVGSSAAGYGWIQRYKNDNSGMIDTDFGQAGVIQLAQGTAAHAIIEQTLARLIVAGQDDNGKGVVYAYTNSGQLDTTFNSSITPGMYSTGIANGVYALVADQFDRIIIAYKNGSNIDLLRLTSSGEVDLSFGTKGIISGAISHADAQDQVKLVLNVAGNIVLAAHTNNNGINAISIVSFDNLSAIVGNGQLVNAEFDFSGIANPTLTNVVTTIDGYILILGTQPGANGMWIARCNLTGTSAVALDPTFNPTGNIPGVYFYTGSGVGSYSGCSVRLDGRIVVVGAQGSNPTMLRIYNDPYTIQSIQSPNAKPIGTPDNTLGLSGGAGVTFFGITGNASQGQVAQAVALQDNNNIVIALDGQSIANTDNRVFINMFDVDGLLQETFGTNGKVEVAHTYQNEYVRGMLTFTVAGVNKAILVGYATNSILNISGSLISQYNLSTSTLDSSFGGLNGNPAGQVFGDAKEAHVVSRQSMGRIIVSGTGQNGNDMILGYTANGNLDRSFGFGGCLTRGTNPIYAHVIDTMNNIVIAYNDGNNNVAVARIIANGSGVDTSFGVNGLVTSNISGISGNSNMRIALDAQGKIVVAAVTNAGKSCVINRYLPTGILDVSLTITGTMLGALNNFTLTKLLVDIDGKVIVVGYDTAKQNQIVIARTTTTVSALDTTFNSVGTPGYLKYVVAAGATQIATDAMIHPDGRIIVVGSEN